MFGPTPSKRAHASDTVWTPGPDSGRSQATPSEPAARSVVPSPSTSPTSAKPMPNSAAAEGVVQVASAASHARLPDTGP